jgi:hypothetical protein
MQFCPKCGMRLPEDKEARFCTNCGALLVPQAVQVKVIIAEFHYWDYGEFSITAMKPRPEIKTEELEKIAQEFNVKFDAKKVAAYYFRLRVIFSPYKLRGSHSRVEIQVSGERPDDVKTCVGRIFLLYGRPDKVPAALSGSKKAGKKIIDELLREFNEGKR